MDAGLEGGQPDAGAEDDVDGQVADPRPPQHGDREQGRRPPRRASAVDAVGVERGDHDDGADVVDDGQAEQEDLELGRDAAAEQREDTEREGDVGRHRDAPPGSRRRRRALNARNSSGGHDHAAERAGAGMAASSAAW